MKRYLSFLTVTVCSILLMACGGHNDPHLRVNHVDDPTVPYEKALQMVANYAPRAGYVVRDGDSLPNSRTAWFSLERMEALVAKLRSEDADGLRIYFAAYDSTYTAATNHVPPPEYWGYNTVLLVSTRDSVADGIHYHRDYYGGAADDLHRGLDGLITTAAIENFGGMCPPPPDCHDEGATLLPRQ